MHGGIKDRRRPHPVPRIAPFTRLAGDAQFNVVMRCPRINPADAAARAGIGVPVRRVTHVTAEVEVAGVGGAVGGTGRWSVDAINGVSDHLPGLSHRHGSPQLDAHAAARQEVTHQRIIRYLVEPARRPLGISAQRQHHVTRHQGHVIVVEIIQLGKTQIHSR